MRQSLLELARACFTTGRKKHEALKQGFTLEESKRDELKRLRKENKELRMEKEILKIPKGHAEVSAFFAREMK